MFVSEALTDFGVGVFRTGTVWLSFQAIVAREALGTSNLTILCEPWTCFCVLVAVCKTALASSQGSNRAHGLRRACI